MSTVGSFKNVKFLCMSIAISFKSVRPTNIYQKIP